MMASISDRQRPSFIYICIAIFAILCYTPLVSSFAISNTNNKVSAIAMTRRAMELSNKANNNPIFAKEACELWTNILKDDTLLPLSAMSAAHGIYAATLVRIGRDKDAIVQYKKSLNYLTKDGTKERLTNEEADIKMGLGKSLQRMLKYEEAARIFEGVSTKCADNGLSWVNAVHSESIQNAALCSMRVGDLDSAVTILEKYKEGQNAEVDGMLGTCLLLQQSASSSTNELEKQDKLQKAYELLKVAALDKSVSPLYKWIYHTTNINQGSSMSTFQYPDSDLYLSFAKINNSPFDEFGLLQLDDKILLHSMIKDNCDSSDFWPQGYILPTEYKSFLDSGHLDETSNDQKKWILKERSGYGSNGNTILSTNEVRSLFDTNKLTEPILCQRIVEPPMLINNLKFSLRVYVVYFPRDRNGKDAEVYISHQGLAKYAAEQYDITSMKSNANDDQYMTNSGRGDGRSSKQTSLQVLKSEFQKNDLDYELMWDHIEQSVQHVMQGYLNNLQHGDSSPCSRIGLLNMPKILGFDFILDSSLNPFLLEVNRFPGLEARSREDKDVKQAIVYDAWIKACDRINIRKDCIQNLCPKSYKGSSLTRISIT